MPDYLSMVERGLKAVRHGIFQASDKLAETLDGLCRAPEVYPRYEMTAPGSFVIPDSAAGSPQNAAVVAPSPKQGSDSGPADSDILTSPAGPPQLDDAVELQLADFSILADSLRSIANLLDPPQK